jgi:membrane-bound serine protease (ClpP class)
MHRRTVEDPLRASSTRSRWAVRRTVPKLAALLITAGVGVLVARPAGATGDGLAQACGDSGGGPVAVVEVDGLLDPVLVDFVEDQVHAAERACAEALVLQLDSGGAVVSEGELDGLVATIEGSSLPVDVWIGPSGSKAADEAVRLVAAAGVTGIAPGSSIEVTPSLLDARGVDPGELGTVDVGDRVGARRAVELGLVDSDAPVIGQFVVDLPGVETEVVDGNRQLADTQEVRFSGLSLVGQLMHTVASPAVAYLLFVIGLALLLFELYTAGVGIAGMVGADALILGCYGLAVLPTRPIGVALLLLAMFGYGVDVQSGVPRLWTGIATVSFVLGSLLLYDGLSVSWITLLAAFVGITLAMYAGMPTMVRTRFSTPTIGREWMIGELGEARTDIAPDGVITLRDAPWRARTNRATPIHRHERARVVAIEGLVLEVEPEGGGARDYRERGRSSD